MKSCSECGKKLRFWEGYIHPIQGRNYLVCSNCFDYINTGKKFYQKCLFEGRKNHKSECYFWDSKKKKCKNEKYFKDMDKKKKN